MRNLEPRPRHLRQRPHRNCQQRRRVVARRQRHPATIWLAGERRGRHGLDGVASGTIADYARTADSTFANARAVSTWDQSGIRQLRPSVAEFRQIGSRSFALNYQWQIGETLMRDYRCFVHFVSGDDIAFQDDHALPRPTSTWKTGETLADGPHDIRLPEGLPDGDYGLRIGLYLPDAGRLTLLGRNDGQDRIRAGTVHVRDSGQHLTFESEPPVADDASDIYRHRLNLAGKVIDFGDVHTDGSVLVRRENGDWVLRALPRDGDFIIELSAARFGQPLRVRCVDGSVPSVTPQVHGSWWQIHLDGAKEYRWR